MTNELTHATKLLAEKDALELQISALLDSLKDMGVGMSDSLIDADGFPRADIDVYTIRHVRNQIIRLKTDLKNKMKEMEAALYTLHSVKWKESVGEDSNSPPAQRKAVFSPFLKINKVLLESPSHSAGFQANDLILKFGNIQFEGGSEDLLKKVASLVALSENKSIAVTLSRDRKSIETTLVPKKWSGRGLLG
ncbi:26S proteasome non-ATPase regulatory subunit 9 [Nowakowskiella sp. JEL0407]|nr:26S proteasome non-ATPase regulatory subunit 9 [Nowakowskiella sp. JEL0407]